MQSKLGFFLFNKYMIHVAYRCPKLEKFLDQKNLVDLENDSKGQNQR